MEIIFKEKFEVKMSQIILIEPNKEMQDVYTANLSTYTGANVILRQGSEEAIQLLEILPSIDLVITHAKLEDSKIIEKIHEFLKNKNLAIPILAIGLKENSSEGIIQLPEKITCKELVNSAAKILGITAKDLREMIVPEYLPAPLRYFYQFDKSCCDVFIRIKKQKNEYQFIKRFHIGATIDRSKVEQYEEEGMKYFFIGSKDRLKLTNHFTDIVLKKLEREDLSQNERIEAESEVYELVQDKILEIGVSPETLEVAEIGIKSMTKGIEKSKEQNSKLSGYLKSVLADKTSYAYKHCYLISIICHSILENIEWANPEHIEKLCFVSFFHDIPITDEKLLRIHNNEEMEKANLSDDEEMKVYSHAFDAAKLLGKSDKIPLDADKVIIQHHGDLNGRGFSEVFSDRLMPLAIIFMIAEEFAHVMLNAGEKHFNAKDFIQQLRIKYEKESFKKITLALEKGLSAGH